MIMASTDKFRTDETMRRIEQGRHHLDRNMDKVEPLSDGTVIITFGAFLTLYFAGDQFWQGVMTAPPGRALPRLATYHRVYMFLQAIQVAERISTASVSTLRIKPADPYFQITTCSPSLNMVDGVIRIATVAEELRSLGERWPHSACSYEASARVESAAHSLGYENSRSARLDKALPDVLSAAIEAEEAEYL